MFVPNLGAALTDKEGKVKTPWNSFFQQFSQKAPAAINVFVDGSPFSYQTAVPGSMFITGGTVTGIDLTRGFVTIGIDPATQIVPMAVGDTVVVTHSALPTLQFLANY